MSERSADISNFDSISAFNKYKKIILIQEK